MPSRLFPYAFLLSFEIISTFAIPDIRYYQDLLPELSREEIHPKQLERLLKATRLLQHLENFGGEEEEEEEQRQDFTDREALRDDLIEKSNIVFARPWKRRQKHFSNHPGSQTAVNDLGIYPAALAEFEKTDPLGFSLVFQRYRSENANKLTEAKTQRPRQNDGYPTVGYHPDRGQVNRERGMKEEPLFDRGGKYLSQDRQDHETQHRSTGVIDDPAEKPSLRFTYSYNGADKWGEDSGFALRPDQDGYYDTGDSISAKVRVDSKEDDIGGITEQVVSNNEKEIIEPIIEDHITGEIKLFREQAIDAEDGELSEFARDDRADAHSPSVMAVRHEIGNDIYFVAVVAGCSAAAMFVLVLISLTWCRLHRGAKAAADVEYPAYGVTGPNKDTSPSGDRRLAQSAQMYHYQHQKQQIIAMESRTATARDPGSVSEAESDEENEEGDYTVYECPGLAPTGEMEVKNPLFHDDPTPATPAGQDHRNKGSSEDHNM